MSAYCGIRPSEPEPELTESPDILSMKHSYRRPTSRDQSFGGGKALGPVAFAALNEDPGDLESGHFSQFPNGEIGICRVDCGVVKKPSASMLVATLCGSRGHICDNIGSAFDSKRKLYSNP